MGLDEDKYINGFPIRREVEPLLPVQKKKYWFVKIWRRFAIEEYTISLEDNVNTFYKNHITEINIYKEEKRIDIILNPEEQIVKKDKRMSALVKILKYILKKIDK